MFSKNRGNSLVPVSGDSKVPTIIASDLSVIGNLVSEGSIEIAGRIEGNIKCETLNLHPSGLIKGDVIAKSLKINGEINGVVKAKQVHVAEKGRVHGFVIYESLSISEGAVIFGQLKQTDRDDIADETVTIMKEPPAPATTKKMRLVNKNSAASE